MPDVSNIIAIFCLLNSFGTLPLFLALTKDENFRGKASTALYANITAVILLSVFICLGKGLMTFFGLTLSAFEIGGGIILFKIGLEMLNCTLGIEGYIKEASKIQYKSSSAIVPLGIPLLAGPGCIAVIMTITVSRTEGSGVIGVLSSLVIASIFSYIVWVLGGYVFLKYKGEVIRDIISKLGGLFLLILSIQMIINGISKLSFFK
ncbi:MAG: hypothetical protein A2017_01310 [Lentisphaerae bacterium GWF2_44_16]|nr:MAG: hypothetical protein A2017_01310 [Lentisphaerae bacterium GWF2_44_16]